MIVYPLKSREVRIGDSLFDHLLESLRIGRMTVRTGDVIVVSSKIVALSECRVRRLSNIKPDRKAQRLAREYSLPPPFVQIVIDETDRVIGGVKGVLLTVTAGDATANSGVDRKNAPSGTVVLWPKNPDISARKLNHDIRRRFKKKVGVVIADSRVTPLRLGTIGQAIGCWGFGPLKDFRGNTDIYGRKIQITFQAVADSIATAAQLVMGEADEKVPFALVRDAPVDLSSRSGIGQAKLDREDCLYMSQIRHSI